MAYFSESFGTNAPQSGGTFGMKKIISHRTGANGFLEFQVEWESTWEPADALASCESLVKDYFVRVRSPTLDSKPAKRMLSLDSTVSEILEDYRLTAESKINIQQLIDSALLPVCLKSENLTTAVNEAYESRATPAMKTPSKKQCMDAGQSPGSSGSVASSGVQYLENFSNPYVKIVVVCKVCNKEQHPQRPGSWKRHYLTHVDDDEKPFKCGVCGKAFIEHDKFQKHLKTHS